MVPGDEDSGGMLRQSTKEALATLLPGSRGH
jgi:hypothetical protein